MPLPLDVSAKNIYKTHAKTHGDAMLQTTVRSF